jgi:hypothetical protein
MAKANVFFQKRGIPSKMVSGRFFGRLHASSMHRQLGQITLPLLLPIEKMLLDLLCERGHRQPEPFL